MNVAWTRKTGAASDADSSGLGRVLRGQMMFSSSMLQGKLAFLRASIVGIDSDGVSRLSFMTRGILPSDLILKMPEPSLTTSPASHGKLAASRSRPFDNVLTIVGCEEGLGTGKKRDICVYSLGIISCPTTSRSMLDGESC